jgi:hypothetical protein
VAIKGRFILRNGSRVIRNFFETATFCQNDLAMRNTADEIGGKAHCRLIWPSQECYFSRFYDIHEKKVRVPFLLFCPGHYTRLFLIPYPIFISWLKQISFNDKFAFVNVLCKLCLCMLTRNKWFTNLAKRQKN